MSGPFNAITHLLKVLFTSELNHFVKREHEMISKNIALGGGPDGFRHLGTLYTQLEARARIRGQFTLLHLNLIPEMDQLLADRKVVEDDRDRIRQAFAMSLRDCKTPQDYRDALPNSCIEFFSNTKDLPRTRPEAYGLVDNPKSYTQYMKLRERIDYYIATRLIS